MPALTEKQTSSATRAKLASRTRSCIAESDTRQPGLLLLTVRLHPCPPSQTPKPGASHTRLIGRGRPQVVTAGTVAVATTPDADVRDRSLAERLPHWNPPGPRPRAGTERCPHDAPEPNRMANP